MIPTPQFVARINFKPLIPLDELERIKPERVLKSLQREILKSLRSKIMQSSLSARARQALAKTVGTKLGRRSVTVYSKHPGFKPLLQGQKPGQMRWLMKAKVPIPIALDTGEVIFRSATAKSMQDGRWIHPGRKPTTVVELARREAREVVKRRVKKEMLKQLRAAMQRGRGR